MRRFGVVVLALLLAAAMSACVGSPSKTSGEFTPQASAFTPQASAFTPSLSAFTPSLSAACGSVGPMAANAQAPGDILACATPVTTGPPGGLSRNDAVKIALRLAPPSSSPPRVVRANPDPYYGLVTSVPRGTWVWMIALEGNFEDIACPTTPASPRPCGTATHGLEILIDYYTGALVDLAFE